MAERRRFTWPDLALATVLVFVGLMGTGPAVENQGQTIPTTGYVLVVAAALATVAWRWRPAWTAVLSGSAVVVYIGLGYAYGPILFALVVAVYGVTSRYPVRPAVAGAGAILMAGTVAVGIGVGAGDRDWTEFASVAGWVVVPAAVGVVMKVRQDAAARVRAEQARRGVSEERLRLAQEVHDVVGHSLAVIAMQAGVVLRLLDRDPARARSGVETIRSTSTEALDSLRAELDALRRVSPQPDVPHRPYTRLADLPGLVDRIRASGLPVTVRREEAGELPAEVDHAAYRIVQEALTNVLRHGGPDAVAQVRIAQAPDTLRVEVSNTGAAPAPGDAGHGIAGMRERAEVLGGAIEALPQPSGGFAVRARLPLRSDDGRPGAGA
jgi:signal transduction histidine kinase